MNRWRTSRIWLAQLVGLAALSGCSLSTTVPQDHYYRLPDPQPATVADAGLARDTLAVAPFHTTGLYQERSILYIDTQQPLEVNRYHYHHWIKSPVYLVQEHMLDYLRETGVAARVIRHEPGVDADSLINGTIKRFERHTGPDRDEVRVTLELSYTDPDSQGASPWTREYSVIQPTPGRTIQDVISAFGAALDEICNNFVRDISTRP